MTIEKIKPNFLKHEGFPQPFTIILNSTIDLIPDDSALGIYLYLARKPDDWIIQETDIMKRFSRGRDHVRKAMKVLKETGLLDKTANRDEKGRVMSWNSTLYAHITENPSSGYVHITENPECGQPQAQSGFCPDYWKPHLLDNPTHTKERELQRKELIIKTTTREDVFFISDIHDQRLLTQRITMGCFKDFTDHEFLEICRIHIDNRDKTKYNVAQSVAGLCKLIAQGTFEPPASYTSKKEEAKNKQEQEIRQKAMMEAQDRQHKERLEQYQSRKNSAPACTNTPFKLSELLKGKL